MILKLIYLCLCFKSALSSSVGSNSEALLTCSKFHFEEKVLEKLVRLEHKMELNEENIKKWEELFFSKLDKMDRAINNAEIFVESMRENQLQEQSRVNYTYHEIVERFKIQSKNETELNGEQINTALQSLSEKLHEFSETEKNRELVLESMRNSLYEDQLRFNHSFDITMGESIKQTKIFVESMRDTQLQQQSHLNDSYHKIVEHFNIQSKNATKIHRKQMDIMLKSLSSKIEEFSVAEKKRENTLGSMQNTLHQEQKRFNQSFEIKVRQSMKQTETFEKSMRDIQLQELSRLNNSYLEIVEHFKIQSKNVTEIHGKQMDIMLKSLSSKLEEFSEAEKNRKRNLESMQNTLHQDQQRFNQSFDLALQNIRLSTNRTVHEQIAQQKRDYEALMEKRTTVAFSAYTKKSQAIRYNTNIKFEKIWTNMGNGYNPSTGIFTAPRQGVYHITAVVMSVSGVQLYLHLKHNNEYTAGSLVNGDGYKTGTFDVVLNLQKGDTMSVGSKSSYTVYSDSDKYTTFSGHLIT